MSDGKQLNPDPDKKRRFNGVRFTLDDIPKSELETLKFGFTNSPLGPKIDIFTDNQKIETDFITGYHKDPNPNKPGFNFKHSNVVTNSTLTTVEQNINRFDILVALDTNTKLIENKKVHIGYLIEITAIEVKNFKYTNPKFDYRIHFIFEGNYSKPELINWKNAIEYIIAGIGHNSPAKVGLVVDSELGSLPSFNKRQNPIIGNFYLPPNFELLYASADTKNDSVLNQAIAYCDKMATQILNETKQRS